MRRISQKGFSFIEIIIVVVILAMLAALSATVLTSQRHSFNLEKDALSFKSFIKECQSYANKYSVPVQLIKYGSNDRVVFYPKPIVELSLYPTTNIEGRKVCKGIAPWGDSEDRGRASGAYNFNIGYINTGIGAPQGLEQGILNNGWSAVSSTGNAENITIRPQGAGIIIAKPKTNSDDPLSFDLESEKNQSACVQLEKGKNLSLILVFKGGGDAKVYKSFRGKFVLKSY